MIAASADAWVVRLVCRLLRSSRAREALNSPSSAVSSVERCRLAERLGLGRHALLWAAAGSASLVVIRWALKQGMPRWRVASAAALYGNLNVLRWARRAGLPLGHDIMIKAARGSHLHVLRWAARLGYAVWPSVCTVAAGAGHLEVLKWAHTRRCGASTETIDAALTQGHLEVLEWLGKHSYPMPGHLSHEATRHPRAVEWAIKSGIGVDVWTCVAAARRGQLDSLVVLRDAGCAFNGRGVIQEAARGGHARVIEWALANGGELTPHACTLAARGGHLEALMSLRAAGCEWNHWVMIDAAAAGQLKVLRWAASQGCEWSWDQASAAMKRCGDPATRAYLRGVLSTRRLRSYPCAGDSRK